jgi:hypothetical protein
MVEVVQHDPLTRLISLAFHLSFNLESNLHTSISIAQSTRSGQSIAIDVSGSSLPKTKIVKHHSKTETRGSRKLGLN